MPTAEAGGGLGALLRFALAAGVWVLPGFALHRLVHRRRDGDPLLAVAFAPALAAFATTVAAFLALATGIPVVRFPWVLLVLAAAAAAILVLVRSRPPAGELPDAPGAAARWVGFLSVALLVLGGAWVGGTLRFTTDAPDHVGTLREILASGRYFPTEAFHLGAGILGADPRKGLLHPVYAALSRLAGLDPAAFWRWLPALTGAFPFLAGYGFLRSAGYRAGWALAGAWVLTLSWNGGPGGDLLGISGYPNQVGAALFWLGFGASIGALRRPGTGAVAAAAMVLAAAVTVHPMYVVFVALLGGMLLLYALGPARPRGPALRVVVILGAALAVVLVPYLLYRYTQYRPGNPIHTAVQGMLFLGDRTFIADPGLLWRHLGWAGLVGFPAAAVVFLPRWRRGAAPFLIALALVAMALLTLNPLFVPVLQERLTYLVFRSLWILPAGLAAGAALGLLAAGERGALGAGDFAPGAPASPAPGPGRPARAGALLVAAAVILPAALSLPRWTEQAPARDGIANPRIWRADLAAVDAALPPRSTVLSDPVTSYLLPAFTTQRTVAPYDQHSSPNDSLALGRILAARDVLSPGVPLLTAWETARRWGADYVLVNTAFPGPVRTDYWSFDRNALRARERAFRGSPLFRPLLDRDGFALFAVAPTLPDSLPPEDLRSPVLTVPAPPGPPILDREGLALVGASAGPDTLSCRDTLAVRLTWTPTRAGLPPEPLRASLRLDALDAPGRGRPAEKLLRKLAAAATGTRYRARTDWIPSGGRLAFDRWTPGRAITDTVRIRPPCALAPGRYAVTVTVNRIPHMPNYRLRDYLSNRDLYAGPAVDTVTVVPRPLTAASRRRCPPATRPR